MCVGIGAALSLVVGVAQAFAQQSAADAQFDAEQERFEANQREAKRATIDRFDAINTKALQERAAASQKLQETAIEGVKARSTARVASTEGGVSGLSVDALLADFYAKEGRFNTAIQTNFEYGTDFLHAQGASARAQGQSQSNSVAAPIPPSFAGAAIRILGSGVKAFSSFSSA